MASWRAASPHGREVRDRRPFPVRVDASNPSAGDVRSESFPDGDAVADAKELEHGRGVEVTIRLTFGLSNVGRAQARVVNDPPTLDETAEGVATLR